jgi:regulator of protease activity HflC (stomatin/prohibitin superfamily)
MSATKNETIAGIIIVGVIIGAIVGVIALGMWGLPKYKIYKQNLHGQAQLREAEWTKKISIEGAKAKKESAVFQAEAEAIRAKGVAKANKIIGDSLKDNEGYLRYLWIDGLNETTNRVIYVPTEGNLPILEAGKR